MPDVAIVLGCGVADLDPAVDEACVAGVLAESGQGVGPASADPAALYNDMPTPVRATLAP